MKKQILAAIMALVIAAPAAIAQEAAPAADAAPSQEATSDSAAAKKHVGTWTTSSTPALKVDEKYYNNWSASGNSQVALTAAFKGNYKYTHPKFIWDNVADLAFGIFWQDLDGDKNQTLESFRKNDDKIDLTSTYSMVLKRSWNVNAIANFKTQFYKGYTYSVNDAGIPDTTLVSTFMNPAYLTTAIGFEYKKEFWNLSLSFLTGKTTFVCNDSLIAHGNDYGVPQKDSLMNLGIYRHAYFGLGSYVKFYFKKDVAKNLNLYLRAELFYDYLKRSNLEEGINGRSYPNWVANKGYGGKLGYCLFHEMDVDFELMLEYRFNAFLAAYAGCQLKYDSDFISPGGKLGHFQLYQSAGLQVYFDWKTPKPAKK